MRSRRIPGTLTALSALLLLNLAGGCARLPPGQNALSGKRLHVILTFGSAINPGYLYYFIINNSNNRNAPGPIPVGAPVSGFPYGNGFATSSDQSTTGFTDFVLFSNPLNFSQYTGNLAQGGYGLYHVINGNDEIRTNMKATGAPISFVTPPDPSNPNSVRLEFEIDMSQLITDANGNPLTDTAQAATIARNIQIIQVNVVATNTTPIDGQTSVIKAFDSFGDDTDGHGTYITLDISKPDTITSGDQRYPGAVEPTSNDVFPIADQPSYPELDLKSWSIEIRQK
jgi:hypothetical protein